MNGWPVAVALLVASGCSSGGDPAVCEGTRDASTCPSGTKPYPFDSQDCRTAVARRCGAQWEAYVRCDLQHPVCVDPNGVAVTSTLNNCSTQFTAWSKCLNGK